MGGRKTNNEARTKPRDAKPQASTLPDRQRRHPQTKRTEGRSGSLEDSPEEHHATRGIPTD